jgi:hypothetical protein
MEHWDNVFEEVPASFEDRIVSTLASLEEKPKIRRFRMPAGSLIAAALAVVILGGTAWATDFFGLKSITVADPYATPEATGDVIALQGVPDSPEFKANAQWMDYLAQTGAVSRSAAPDAVPGSESYALYSVYTPEMGARLESIAAAYSLRLHTSQQDFYSEQELYSLTGTAPFISNCAAISGYVYEDGSFQGDGTNVAGRFYEYQFGRYKKGSFSEVTLNIGNASDYDEWIYATSSGVTVQLSMGPDRCVLLADLPDSFVAVNLLGGTAGNSLFMPDPVTKEDLQAFADMFDFSAIS